MPWSAPIYLLLSSFSKLLFLPRSIFQLRRKVTRKQWEQMQGTCFGELIEILLVTTQGLLETSGERKSLSEWYINCPPYWYSAKDTDWDLSCTLAGKFWGISYGSCDIANTSVASTIWFLQIAADTQEKVSSVERHSWLWWQLKEVVFHHFSLCPQPWSRRGRKRAGAFCLAVLWHSALSPWTASPSVTR